MHKTIIFDCGNVLIGFSRLKLLDVYVGNCQKDRDLVDHAVFDNWDVQDSGVPSKKYYEMVIKNLPERLHGSAFNIIFHWKEQTWPMPGMFDLVKRLKESGHQIVLLSNMPDTFTYDHDDIPVLKYFDELIFSFPLGFAKPDRRIFEYTFEKCHIDKSSCIFVDDNENNIKGAIEAGIEGYLFDKKNPQKYIDFANETEFI